jgi:hypothetical protein
LGSKPWSSLYVAYRRCLIQTDPLPKILSVLSSPCEPAREKADAGDEKPGPGADDGSCEVLGEAAIASEPGEGAFDGPALELGCECTDPLRSGDNLDRPFAKRGDGVTQLVAAVDAIGKDVPPRVPSIADKVID